MIALTFNTTAVQWLACKGLGWLHPGVYWSAASGLRLREVPVPPLPSLEWVRLRTRLGGICGTDLAMVFLRGHPGTFLRAFVEFPIIPGHENVAVVEEAGPRAREWAEGTRVCVEPSLSCVPRGIDPPCQNCQAGQFCLCDNFLHGGLPKGVMVGATFCASGSWATHFVAHKSQLHAVPDGIPDEQALLVDPMAGALHGVLRRRPANDERVLVLGGGIIGIGVVAAIRAIECQTNVTAVVRHRFQEDLMRKYGADQVIRWSGSASKARRYQRIADAVGGRRVAGPFGNQMIVGGFDVVYDCVGTGASLTDAMKFARARGTVVELGTSQICLVDTTPLWFSEVTILGAYGRQFETWNGRQAHTYRIVFELMESGRLPAAGLLTHVFDLRDYRHAFRTLSRRGEYRVVKAAFQSPVEHR